MSDIADNENERSQPMWLSRVNIMLVVMIALAVLSQFFRSSNGVIAPEMMAEMHVDASAIGLSSGAFFVIFAVLQIPIGVLFDRYGARHVVSSMLIFAVIGSCLFAVAQSIGMLVAGRFLIGLGFAGGMVGSLVILSRWHSPSDFIRAMTILFAAANLGSLLATSPLAAATDWIGWRSTFLVLSAFTAIMAVIFFVTVRDTRPGAEDSAARPQTLGDSIRGLRDVFRVPGLLRVVPLIALGYASVITIIGLWGAPYLHEVHNLESLEGGHLLSVLAIAFVIGTLAYGPIQRRVSGFRRVVVAGSAATGGLLIVLALFAGTSLVITVPLLVVICTVGAYSVVLMGHGVALIPSTLVGRGTTTLNGVLMGGTAILQIVSGLIVEAAQTWFGTPVAGYAAFFAILGLATLAATVFYLRAPEPVRGDRRPD
ncbi:MFS transporter [Thalassobaculum sp.]|uniref:MFS transporter n=1 Tax=Thalassobaculum sp. TaxID=2022740 RepID=UPI0032ED82AD